MKKTILQIYNSIDNLRTKIKDLDNKIMWYEDIPNKLEEHIKYIEEMKINLLSLEKKLNYYLYLEVEVLE